MLYLIVSCIFIQSQTYVPGISVTAPIRRSTPWAFIRNNFPFVPTIEMSTLFAFPSKNQLNAQGADTENPGTYTFNPILGITSDWKQILFLAICCLIFVMVSNVVNTRNCVHLYANIYMYVFIQTSMTWHVFCLYVYILLYYIQLLTWLYEMSRFVLMLIYCTLTCIAHEINIKTH